MRWVLLLALAAAPARSEPETFRWRDDLAAARKEAARTGKPLLVAFRCEP
jgi:hypothetical protein